MHRNISASYIVPSCALAAPLLLRQDALVSTRRLQQVQVSAALVHGDPGPGRPGLAAGAAVAALAAQVHQVAAAHAAGSAKHCSKDSTATILRIKSGEVYVLRIRRRRDDNNGICSSKDGTCCCGRTVVAKSEGEGLSFSPLSFMKGSSSPSPQAAAFIGDFPLPCCGIQRRLIRRRRRARSVGLRSGR